MFLGRWDEAWKQSERIESSGRPDPLRFWDGLPLDGRRIIVRCLHGLGDTLQYLRFAVPLRPRLQSLSIEAQPHLKRFLSDRATRYRWADTVITWGDEEPQWNAQIEINELPRILRVTPETAALPRNYLAIHTPAAEFSGNLRVGLIWRSGSYDEARSLSPELLDELLEIEGIEWVSLQTGPSHEEVARWGNLISTRAGEAPCPLETAALMEKLDLIISVDTMGAHLAGSLRRPLWLLLRQQADWRWMLHRQDSPWYPTARLFRQTREGEWRPVVRKVKEALWKLRSRHRHRLPLCLEA